MRRSIHWAEQRVGSSLHVGTGRPPRASAGEAYDLLLFYSEQILVQDVPNAFPGVALSHEHGLNLVIGSSVLMVAREGQVAVARVRVFNG